jgi:hypothetical protein
MERGEMAASGSQDSLPFAEEDASLVDSPDCDLSNMLRYAKIQKPWGSYLNLI